MKKGNIKCNTLNMTIKQNLDTVNANVKQLKFLGKNKLYKRSKDCLFLWGQLHSPPFSGIIYCCFIPGVRALCILLSYLTKSIVLHMSVRHCSKHFTKLIQYLLTTPKIDGILSQFQKELRHEEIT